MRYHCEFFTIFALLFILFPIFAYAEETKTIFVGPSLVDCMGVGPQKCMQIREVDSEWQNFYGQIEGFEFVEGFTYKLIVQIDDVVNPPADSSSKHYKLVEIMEKNSMNHHVPYQKMCAPGFVPLGQICVLNDRCGPGAYPGKVCVMDNKIQPYLKPLKQGNAGIATSSVICAENLQLIFKYDAAPACVKPETASKLEMRGWYLEKPPIPCTKEYSPICGLDGKTYGNLCMLKAEHMGAKQQGECKAVENLVTCTLEWNPVCGVDGKTHGNLCMLDGSGIELKHQGECTTITEIELDEKYQSLQDSISSVSSDIYNGRYNGVNPLDQALSTLEDAKHELMVLKEQYDMLENEYKSDKQIAMRFSTLGKMGFASIDSQINIIKNQIENLSDLELSGVFPSAMKFTTIAPEIDSEKGYFVTEIAKGVYWLLGSGYQTMFVTTGQGVIVVDAPQPIGKKYLEAIKEVTSEPVTHMIYSHSHADHTGAAWEVFSPDIVYISHQQAAEVLKQEDNTARPIPNVTFDDSMYSLSLGDQVLELYYLGNFHSKGDVLILAPKQKVAMIVDLLRPSETPYRAFGVTPDIDLYLKTHDALETLDFDVLISGHTNLLATKDDIKTNKQFAESVMSNAKMALDAKESDPIDTCVQNTTQQWTGKLNNLDAFMVDHCTAMLDYLKS